MIILDFLFYYLVLFTKNIDRRTVKTVSYPEHVSYLLGILLLIWLMTINGVIEFFLFNTFISKVPGLIFIILALLFMALLRYIYIKKGRFNRIMEKSEPRFKVSDKTGIIISVSFFFSSVAIFMLTAVILHKLK
ncbi:MAG: hypothetical protein WCL51_05095 [Bacteroidota bacterium]